MFHERERFAMRYQIYLCVCACACVYEEVAVSQAHGTTWTTGGGFSNLTFLGRPTYQSEAVDSYVKNAPSLPPSNWFNVNVRKYDGSSVC